MFIKGWTDSVGNTISYELSGVYMHPDGTRWSSKPFTKEQKAHSKAYKKFKMIFDKVTSHLARTKRTIPQEIELIKSKRSTLPRYCRDWLLNVNTSNN